MSFPIKITRNSHIDHLSKSMPIVMLLFVGQIYIMKESYPTQKLGDYSIFCALTICAYIGALFYYDKNLSTLIYPDKIETHTFLGKKIEIPFHEIVKVIGPNSECKFSTIVICTKDKVVPLRFIDNPIQIQNKILSLKTSTSLDQEAA